MHGSEYSFRGEASPSPRKEIPMSLLSERMIQDMQLHGFSASTQDVYVRAVRQLCQYVHHGPEKVTEEELRGYFLYLTNEKKSSRSTKTQSHKECPNRGRNHSRRSSASLRLLVFECVPSGLFTQRGATAWFRLWHPGRPCGARTLLN